MRSATLFVACGVTLLLLLCSAVGLAAADGHMQVSMPRDLNDPRILRLPRQVGLPGFDNIAQGSKNGGAGSSVFEAMSSSQIDAMLALQFPLLFGKKNQTTAAVSATFKTANTDETQFRFEMLRFTIFNSALRVRGAAGDKKVVTQMQAPRLSQWYWECPLCTEVVEKLEGMLTDEGCDLASGGFGVLCAAIPGLDAFTAECVSVLNWACGKVLSLIEAHITSPGEICDDVFSLTGCNSASGSGSAPASASGSSGTSDE